MELFTSLREFNTASVILRLILSVIFGGIIGINREYKHRPAGFRTYMLVCLGAALTMILGQYEYFMLHTAWSDAFLDVGLNIDISRFGAQVINGIGFLGTGTILVTERHEVKGLTTAAGLWASACMGLAIGAGFYECMLLGFFAIFLSIQLFSRLENMVIENSRVMNLYVEFTSLERVGDFIGCIKSKGIEIFNIEIDRGLDWDHPKHANAVFYLHLPHKQSHTELLTALSYCSNVHAIDEI